MNDSKPLIVDAPILASAPATIAQLAAPKKPQLATSLISAAGLVCLEIPKRRRLLDTWLCEGDLGYLFAPRGCGKTWFALAILAAVSQGKGLGAWQAGESAARTLYIDGEMPLELLRYRARGMGLDQGDANFLHHDRYFEKQEAAVNIARREDREAITETLVTHEFSMLVLDNLSSLASGVDENNGADYDGIGDWLLELRRRKITVIVVHHAGRSGLMRGHSKREDACSWILQLTEAKTENDQGAKFISHFAKPSRNTGEPQPDLIWHFTSDDAGTVKIACSSAEGSEFDTFVQHVCEGVETAGEIAELMNKPKGTISKWVRRAERDGRITRQGFRLLPPDGVFDGGEDQPESGGE